MKKQPFVSFSLANVSLTDFGLRIPSPFCTLLVENSEIDSYTNWTMNIVIGGDDTRKINIAGFEALLYSSAQSAAKYSNGSGVPVSFAFGWLDPNGNVESYTSYTGFTLKFDVSGSGPSMRYTVYGFASLAVQLNMPVLNIPEVCGYVQPSAIVSALAKSSKVTSYYNLDIDHCDSPTLVSHGPLTTSFTDYVRGSYTGEDSYDFPGLLKLSKSYNMNRDAAGIKGLKKLSQGINNLTVTPISEYLDKSLTDNTVQSSAFSFWIDEPTMTKQGTIHYKSNANMQNQFVGDTLEYGTSNTNVISISGSYNGVSYDLTNVDFAGAGFSVDASGTSVITTTSVTNSWSSSVSDAFQSSSIINDLNVLAMQFSGTFNVTIPGTTKNFALAQPVSLTVMMGNTLSPLSGIYNIVKVSHELGDTFITSLQLQRLTITSANQVAISQGISVPRNSTGYQGTYKTTPNVISTSKVDFGEMYPTFEHLVSNSSANII